MKKSLNLVNSIVGAIAFMVLAVIGLFSSSLTIHASAANTTVSFRVERLADYDADYENAMPGDYKITVNIANNTGVNWATIHFCYDVENFTVFDTTETNTSLKIPVIEHYAQFGVSGATVDSTESDELILISIAENTSKRNGDAFSFYLRPREGSSSITPIESIHISQWLVFVDGNPLVHEAPPLTILSSISHSFNYIVGDMDGDCLVGLTDAQILNEVVTESGTIYEVGFTNQFGEYIHVVCFDVADVDADGDIDTDDAQDLLSYYVTTGINGNTYVGTIGDEGIYTYAITIPISYQYA